MAFLESLPITPACNLHPSTCLHSSTGLMDKLIADAYAAKLHQSPMRSVWWRVMLGCLPVGLAGSEPFFNWHHVVELQRSVYQQTKHTHRHLPMTSDTRIIPKDLDRLDLGPSTRPFLQHPTVRALMENVLYTWANAHPLSYCQGMHELLAPIVLTIAIDIRQHAATDVDTSALHDTLTYLLDALHLEDDAYAMFDALLNHGVDKLYLHSSETDPFVVHQALYVQTVLLRQVAPRVADHLEAMDVRPEIYLIRWLRLLFLREFPLTDCLLLWDAVMGAIAQRQDVCQFLNWLAVAMLQTMDQDLLSGDQAKCVLRLMQFPPSQDVHIYIALALPHLQPLPATLPPAYLTICTAKDPPDLVLLAGHFTVYTSRGVLCKHSSVWAAWLQNQPLSLQIEIATEQLPILVAALQCIHAPDAHPVTTHTADALHTLCTQFDIPLLQTRCVEHIRNALSPDNCLRFWRLAGDYPQLRAAILQLCCDQFTAVLTGPSLSTLTPEDHHTLLHTPEMRDRMKRLAPQVIRSVRSALPLATYVDALENALIHNVS
eukprot:NODE_1094_length_1662_cov_97.296417_g1027_i0.p1 GENE.NODE_1094_length_1662_cov_97.296417_g1027_i0~~NODE_1094_length_1662_cov_97.296417_g1027_i0.p1  ORF type:complete len:545 (+),score=101.59 NODE_1094_length_1662_cov_97.296417_g1027_i0:17-1651(+)